MCKHSDICMFVIDVLRHISPGSFESVMNLLNNEGCVGWRFVQTVPFTVEEVNQALLQMVAAKAVSVWKYSDKPPPNSVEEMSVADVECAADFSQLLFAVTAHGMHLWDQWSPPTDNDRTL